MIKVNRYIEGTPLTRSSGRREDPRVYYTNTGAVRDDKQPRVNRIGSMYFPVRCACPRQALFVLSLWPRSVDTDECLRQTSDERLLHASFNVSVPRNPHWRGYANLNFDENRKALMPRKVVMTLLRVEWKNESPRSPHVFVALLVDRIRDRASHRSYSPRKSLFFPRFPLLLEA